MENYFVYRHTAPNGKVYIGCTRSLKRFKYGNGYHSTTPFGKAIKKFGWNNFKHEILYSNLPQDEAFKKEIELIAAYKSNNPLYGYNCSIGGKKSALGYKHTEETKRKIGEATTLHKSGTHHTEETRRKMSQNHADFNGVKHPRSKLTQQQVDEIRKTYKPFSKEFGSQALATKFGVTVRTIQGVIHHQTYK